jgi:predicted DNA-binding protein (UPF0251 family)/predicted Fe-Mo cluster-binding NifX family protein
MPRPTCPRSVGFLPGVTYFKPAGVKIAELKEVVLGHDEIEAVRLKNLEGLSQEEAAKQMSVSQPTLHRLLASAYEKMSDAIVNGKALRIEGGNVTFPETSFPNCGRGRLCAQPRGEKTKKAEDLSVPREGKEARIAVTSVDGTIEGMVHERFGRARHLIVLDPETGESEVIDNWQRAGIPEGAGMQTARKIVGLNVNTVISGHFGPNAFRALEAAGISAYTVLDMTVGEALRNYRAGRLRKLSEADMPGRWQKRKNEDNKGGP